MLRKTRLFTPGPTPLLPAAQRAMAAADLHHRTDEFRRIFRGVLDDLKYFYGTANDVILFTSSGTGAMEAAVSNLFSPGEPILVAHCGKFGERWMELGRAYGLEVECVSAPYGRPVSPAEVADKLASGRFRGLFFQATESSTGVRLDARAMAEAAGRAGDDTLVIVDAITGLGTTHLDIDGWGLDVVIGGSQKALMIPPGLAFAAVSERAWQRMETARLPRYYFDLRKERKASRNGETAYTPSTALVMGLAEALRYVRELGRENLIENARLLAAAARAAATALGLKLFAPDSPCDALTAVCAPEGMDSGAIVKEVRSRFGMSLANGQGSMKGKIFRLAHLGYYDVPELFAVVAALELALLKLGQKIELGSGVRAAQEVYLRRST
jgi:aspartate aminotransferase-like enzyme